MRRAATALVLCAALAGCTSKPDASVGDAVLPQARGVKDAPDGPTLVLPRDANLALPEGSVIRIAADRKVPWKEVAAVFDRIQAAGKQPVLLVGNRWRVKAFTLSDELQGQSIALTATSDGKSCVSPPGEPEAKCVQTIDKDHIDVAYTRELVREAVDGYELYDVDLQVPAEMQWQDVVRAIDAARTCCFDTPVRVKLNR